MTIGTAIALSSVVGAGASIYAGSQAAKAQTHAADQQTDMQQKILDMQKPYIQAGYAALPELEKNIGDYTTSPLYQLQKEQGISSIRGAYGARGMANSPEAIAAEASFGRQLSATEADKKYGRLTDMVKIGQGQAGTTGGQQLQSQQTVGGYLTGAGQAQAQGIGGAGSALMGGAQGYMMNQMWQQYMKQQQPTPTLSQPSSTIDYKNWYQNPQGSGWF